MESEHSITYNNPKEMIYMALLQASSQEINILKPAEAKLRSWETQPGFFSILCEIFLNREVNENIRWIALLYFKNGVENNWSDDFTTGKCISEEEKAVVRSSLMQCFEEPIIQFANQMAVIISKIAGADCPDEWPDLIDTLCTNMKSNNIIVKHRAVLYLQHVIKELSERFKGNKKLFTVFTLHIYPFVLDYWNSSITEFLNMVVDGRTDIEDILSISILAAKILLKLMECEFTELRDQYPIQQFLILIFQRIKSLLEYRIIVKESCRKQVEKEVLILMKILSSVLDDDPDTFVQFINPTLELSFYYGFTSEGSRFMFRDALIRFLNLMKIILISNNVSSKRGLDNVKHSTKMKRSEVKDRFFTPSVIEEIYNKLIGEYFLLTQEELSSWDSNPEEFMSEEVGESWKYHLRPCVESLFLVLMREFRNAVLPFICTTIENNRCLINTNDISAILKKDAAYTTFGLASFYLCTDIDFDSWFLEILINELHDKSSNNRIIRRRICWLIGQWSGVALSSTLRPLLYSEIIKLLNSEEDLVVRLSALRTVQQVIDDFEFDTKIFAEYVPQYVQCFFSLLKEVCECETKMKVLDVLTHIIQRVDSEIRSDLNPLIEYLPLVWHHSAEHNLLRGSIVISLTSIIKILGNQCGIYTEFVNAIVVYSLDLTQDGHVYLLEDGLQLLLAFVENQSSNCDNSILNLFSYVMKLVEVSPNENINVIAKISEAYLLLFPDLFIQIYAQKLVLCLNEIYLGLKRQAIIAVLLFYETLLKIRPNIAFQLLRQPLETILMKICQQMPCDFEYTILNFSLIARVIIHSTNMFEQMLLSVSINKGIPCDVLLSNFLESWLKKKMPISPSEMKKLLAVALLTLLTVMSEKVLSKFDSIISVVIEQMNDFVVPCGPTNTLRDLLTSESYDDDEEFIRKKSEHYIRDYKLKFSDVISSIDTMEFLRLTFEKLQSQLGNENLQQLLNTITDDSTLRAIEKYKSKKID